jgi:hypothetical protein
MPLAKCPRCKSMYNKSHSPVCTSCQSAENTDADAVRQTLEDHPNLNSEQVAELSGVDIQVVLRLVETGAISSVTSLEGQGIKCGRCGAPAISASKKLCQSCLEKLNTEVAKAQRKIQLGDRKAVEVDSFNANVRTALEQKRRR